MDLDLHPGEVVALTGVSGAGKSSLALDTLYAEGQRRFVESFSPYARQFLERLERPPMDSLEPVPAAIAVDRRAPVKSSRSTLATMADIEPFIAALFVREAVPLCPEHRLPAVDLDAHRAAHDVVGRFAGVRVIVTWQSWSNGTEQYLELRDQLARQGYRRLWLDGRAQDIDVVPPSALKAGHGAQVIVDRCNSAISDVARLAAAIEAAWQGSGGAAHVFRESVGGEAALVLRRGRSCPACARPLGTASLGLFSYESPVGACPSCKGFGRTIGIDWNKVIPDPRRTLSKGAIRPWAGKSTTWERGQLRALCRRQSILMDVPYGELGRDQQAVLRSGDGTFDGLEGWFKWLQGRTYKMHVRVLLSRYRSYDECASCNGQRLGAASLDFVVAGLNIAEWHGLEVGRARATLASLECQTDQGRLAQAELLARLTYLDRVGLGYLTLDRQARTLSGGEAQRVTLTAALGTNLHNALFVLDEPSVGLHSSDVGALGELITELATRNNSVLVIEHDAALIRAADRVVELGPTAGAGGGSITFDGTPARAETHSVATARALRRIEVPTRSVGPVQNKLGLRGASEHNLQDVDVDIPLGVLCAISGPSGSGKSTLSVDIVYRSLARRLGAFDVEPPGAHRELSGVEAVRKVILVDQSPLGRTSRGNAATYTKAWDSVRKLFADEPSAKSHALTASHFSFNVALGRCEACSGEGFETVEMQFLADVRLSCPSCQGKRFKPEILSIQRQGVNIAQVLGMTIDEAIQHFGSSAQIGRCLRPLNVLGLGYLRLGQPLSTLSGGEAQRLKLARSLSERMRGSLWILDEPSAGLHANEIELLLGACRHIVSAGGSVLMVEHDLELIAQADWVIDMGPRAGSGGGRVVAEGPPSLIARSDTLTGQALRARAEPAPEAPPRGAVSPSELVVRGAREHNLKQVDVALPHQALTVVTGPSGSGKSSLCFDVIFAEGQRRFLETLTPYARQFLPSMPRPDVDRVSGVPPSVSLEQRTARSGAKSTVATVTEVSHYLRLIFAKLGTLHCPEHDVPVATQSASELLEQLRQVRGTFELCAPAVRARKGTYLDIFSAAARGGIVHAYADGKSVQTDTPPKLSRNQQHTILLVVEAAQTLDRLSAERLGCALSWGKGEVVLRSKAGEERIFSTHGSCPQCGFSESELDPRIFSFNTEQGRCAHCEGQGVVELSAPKKRGRPKAKRGAKAKTMAQPASESAPEAGSYQVCPHCQGSRLASLPRAVRLFGVRYDALSSFSVEQASQHFERLELSGRAHSIGADIKTELSRRLEFLCDVGLGYLSLNRAAATLSGGEMQRLRLAAQLGAGLTGALYVLDEPTIGLHPKDTERLLGNLRRLVKLGSTVLVVEHDADTVRAADYLIDLGPGGGTEGGRIMAAGTPAQVLLNPNSPTGQVLSRPPVLRASIAAPADAWLELSGAAEHNLKRVDLRLPIGRLSVVAGVSGSGKSTLIRRVLLPALREALGLATDAPGAHQSLRGHAPIKRAVSVDQSPIGRTPRSVPATFLGIWDPIRRLFAATNDAMVAGFGPARFSFNSAAAGGRCESCGGMGVITHEMSFLPDVVQACPTCQGQRFEPRTLGVRYRGLNIADVLSLNAERAAQVFANHPKICGPLKTLCDLGTGYITLGQGSHTLSGGEAQRLKLADELTASARHEPTLYVLDEPTTGLHLSDVARLMNVLDRLVTRGDTLVIVEHHPWVIAGADWVVELGPGGGASGGKKIAEGTPKELRKLRTATAQVLKELVPERPRGTHVSNSLGVA